MVLGTDCGEYRAEGTCTHTILLAIDGQIVPDVQFQGVCPGNRHAAAVLPRCRPMHGLIDLLADIRCRDGASCHDQLARAMLQLARRR